MADEDLSKLRIDKSAAVPRPQRRRRLLFAAAAVVAVLLVSALYAGGILTPPVEVEVAMVAQTYPSQAYTLLNASGYVVAQRKAAVSSKVTARLISVAVEEGSRVKAGDVIARLEGDDVIAVREQVAANLAVARAGLEQAKAELQDAALAFSRNKDLIGQGYVSRAEYDASEARHLRAEAAVRSADAAVKSAAAALRNAEVSVEYTFVRAPFDGVVLTKNADVGDIVTPLGAAANAKAAVVNIADMNSLQVEVDVSESNLAQVKVNQPCEIQLDALQNTRFPGVIHMIVPTADRTKATVLVKVRFLEKDSRVLPEMSAKVAFLSKPMGPDEQKPRTTMNPAAIADRNGVKTVFRLAKGTVTSVPVSLGERLGDVVEVLDGVKAGDKVVVRPLNRMRDGLRVRVAEK